ncbi:MAG: DUF5677 domain-containing protein [Vulcanibacillus sp.]
MEIWDMPVMEVLPRNYNDNDEVRKRLEIFSDSLYKLANVGTHIINEIMKKNLENQDISIIMHLRNHIDIIDGISDLIKISSVDNAERLNRMLFESYLYLNYILEKDVERRGKSYYFYYLLEQLKWYNKLKDKTPENISLKEMLKRDKYLNNSRLPTISSIDNEIAIVELNIHNPIFNEVKYEYDTKPKKNRKQWYSLFGGPKNIKELADRLKLPATYEINYRFGSSKVHSQDALRDISYDDERALIKQLRAPASANITTLNCFNYTIDTYIQIIKYFKLDENMIKQYHASIKKYWVEDLLKMEIKKN